MNMSFSDIEERREYIEDFSRRHERFPDEFHNLASDPVLKSEGYDGDLNDLMDEINAKNSDLIVYWSENRNNEFGMRHAKWFYEDSVRRINEKPVHLRWFSGKFMDEFGCLYVGNGLYHASNHLNFLYPAPDTNKGFYGEHILSIGAESKFVQTIDSIIPVEVKQLPIIKNNEFLRNITPELPAFWMIFNDGKEPMYAYLDVSIQGQAYKEGILVIENREGKKLFDKNRVYEEIKDHRDVIMLHELNEYEDGLGGRIKRMLENPNGWHNSGLKNKDVINELLRKYGLSTEQVIIPDDVNRVYPSIETILRDYASAEQFKAQWED